MTFPPTREHPFPPCQPSTLYESEAVLHLSPTRWLLLVFGCVLPEISAALIVFKKFPILSVVLFAAALSTFLFIATVLRKQKCFVRVLPDTIELETRRSRYAVRRKEILECSLNRDKGIILKSRDEVQVLEVEDAQAFKNAFQKMHA